jgi:hypothetical protein
MALAALLLIMALAELFKSDADSHLARMMSALLGIDAISPEAVAACPDGTAGGLLDAARQHITRFLGASGEKPPLSGAVPHLAGHCLQDSECAMQLETVYTEVVAPVDPADTRVRPNSLRLSSPAGLRRSR